MATTNTNLGTTLLLPHEGESRTGIAVMDRILCAEEDARKARQEKADAAERARVSAANQAILAVLGTVKELSTVAEHVGDWVTSDPNYIVLLRVKMQNIAPFIVTANTWDQRDDVFEVALDGSKNILRFCSSSNGVSGSRENAAELVSSFLYEQYLAANTARLRNTSH